MVMGGRKKDAELKIDMAEPVTLTAFNKHSAALRQRLESHRIWIESHGIAGKNFNGNNDEIIANVNPDGADLRRMNLSGITFENFNFTKTRIDDAHIIGTVFKKCEFLGAGGLRTIDRLRAKGAEFIDCDLRGIKFNDCDFEAAKLNGSKYNKESFKYSYIVGMRADGAILKKAAPDYSMMGYSVRSADTSAPDKKLITLAFKGRDNCGIVSAGAEYEQVSEISAKEPTVKKKPKRSHAHKAKHFIPDTNTGLTTLDLGDWQEKIHEEDVSEMIGRGYDGAGKSDAQEMALTHE